MFEGFKKKNDPDAKRRYALSAGASVFLYGAIAAAAMVVGGRVKEKIEEPHVDVVFRPPPPPEEAPPPPPRIIKKQPPPVIPEGMKVKKVDVLPPPAELVAPDKVPDKKLAEGKAEDDVVLVQEGAGKGQVGGVEHGTAEKPVPAPVVAPAPKRSLEPVNLPEDAEPAEEDENNDHDGDRYYPADAKAKGLEGVVILKVVITEKGVIDKITVMKGDEPFVSAAISMVKTWHYQPAKLDGHAIAVFKVLKIPFKLK